MHRSLLTVARLQERASRFAISRFFSAAVTTKRPTVLFCGEDFKPWIESIRNLRPEWDCLEVPRNEVSKTLATRRVDVAVPLMTRLLRDDIAAGKKNGLKLIQQFGAGLEGLQSEEISRMLIVCSSH